MVSRKVPAGRQQRKRDSRGFTGGVVNASITLPCTVRQEAMESSDVCDVNLSLFLNLFLWSRSTVIGVDRELSDDLEISLLLECGRVT